MSCVTHPLTELRHQPSRTPVVGDRRIQRACGNAPSNCHPGGPVVRHWEIVLGDVLQLSGKCAVSGDLDRDWHGSRRADGEWVIEPTAADSEASRVAGCPAQI